jgi:hypothetical protein
MVVGLGFDLLVFILLSGNDGAAVASVADVSPPYRHF